MAGLVMSRPAMTLALLLTVVHFVAMWPYLRRRTTTAFNASHNATGDRLHSFPTRRVLFPRPVKERERWLVEEPFDAPADVMGSKNAGGSS